MWEKKKKKTETKKQKTNIGHRKAKNKDARGVQGYLG